MLSLYIREPEPDEAFESCSRAVQIMPVIYRYLSVNMQCIGFYVCVIVGIWFYLSLLF